MKKIEEQTDTAQIIHFDGYPNTRMFIASDDRNYLEEPTYDTTYEKLMAPSCQLRIFMNS